MAREGGGERDEGGADCNGGCGEEEGLVRFHPRHIHLKAAGKDHFRNA